MATNRFIRTSDDRRYIYGQYGIPTEYFGWATRPWEYEWAARLAGTGRDVLDAASGIGHFFKRYLADEGNRVTAVDIDREIEIHPEHRNLTCLHGDISRHIPVDDASQDVVLCISALEHIVSSIPGVLSEFHRVLRPHGIIAITFDVTEDITPEEFLAVVEDSPLVPSGDTSLELPHDILRNTKLEPTFRIVLTHEKPLSTQLSA